MVEDRQSQRALDQIRDLAVQLGVLHSTIYSWGAAGPAAALVDRLYSLDVIQMWSELLSNTHVQEDYAGIPQNIAMSKWLEGDTLDFVRTIADSMQESLDTGVDPRVWDLHIRQLRATLLAVLEQGRLPDQSLLGAMEWAEMVQHLDYVGTALRSRESQRLTRLADQAQEAVIRTESAANAASSAAGKTGDDVMSSFYRKLAKSETDSADKFRTLTAGFAMAAGAAALIFVLLPSGIFPAFEGTTSDIARLVQKTVFVAGIFGIAGYFARQAHQHRSMANWAESLSVQLQTFDAYLAAIESIEVKDELRKSFAARAFGDHPAMKGEPTVTPTAAAMDTAVGWAAKLTAGGTK